MPADRGRGDGSGGVFVQEFAKQGGGQEIRRVPATYYEEQCAKLDADKQKFLELIRPPETAETHG